jgi:hypothetical protein
MAEAVFKDGKKINPDGEVCELTSLQEFTSSNQMTKYVVSLWSDGAFSCPCPGWAFKKKGKERTCKHVKQCQADPNQMIPIDEILVGSDILQRAIPGGTRVNKSINFRD